MSQNRVFKPTAFLTDKQLEEAAVIVLDKNADRPIKARLVEWIALQDDLKIKLERAELYPDYYAYALEYVITKYGLSKK